MFYVGNPSGLAGLGSIGIHPHQEYNSERQPTERAAGVRDRYYLSCLLNTGLSSPPTIDIEIEIEVEVEIEVALEIEIEIEI